jgi:predicted small lipoprotein YifL
MNDGYTSPHPSPDAAMYRFRPIFRLAAFALATVLLAACGNKGALVKPPATTATPPASVPATPAPPAASDGR